MKATEILSGGTTSDRLTAAARLLLGPNVTINARLKFLHLAVSRDDDIELAKRLAVSALKRVLKDEAKDSGVVATIGKVGEFMKNDHTVIEVDYDLENAA